MLSAISSGAIGARKNVLMAALAEAEWQRVRRSFKPIWMPRGGVLYEPGARTSHLFFPSTSVIALSLILADGRADTITLLGREGFASVAVFLGGDSPPCRAVVQSEGLGYEIRRDSLWGECERVPSMRAVLLRYAQTYITQLALTAVCNRHHSIDQQLCRWLLMFMDRLTSHELTLTQERIAEFMGVRRESVTVAARNLRMAGVIRYHRSHISVVDRAGLEAHACECYGILRRELVSLMELSHLQSARRAAGCDTTSGQGEISAVVPGDALSDRMRVDRCA